MSFLGNFFSPTQNTQGTTNTTQSGTQQGQNQSNLWPQLSGYFGGYGNLSTPGAFNPYQIGGANNQAGVAGGLGQAFNTANYGAAGGLYNPGSTSAFMSPYLNDVATSTIGMQGLQKKQDLSNLRGGQAARGALGNNVGSEAAYLAGRAPADTAAINQIYQQGFDTANKNAQTGAGLQYQGASTVAGLTGAATGANQAQFGMGQTLWNDPLSWGTQWSQGLSPWTQAAGQNYTGSNQGTSIGQNNSTTTTTPSPWQIASGIGGMALGMFADGGRVPSYAMGGGMPGGLMSLPGMGGIMDVMKSKDMPASGLSSLGDIGSLGSMGLPFARGGGVGSSFADKVMHAHHVLKRMQGGRANFDEGGWVTDVSGPLGGPPSSNDAHWDDIQRQAMANPNGGQSQPTWSQKLGGALTKAGQIGGGSGGDAIAKANAGSIDALNRSRSDLTAFMAQNNPLRMTQGTGYADGGRLGYEGGGETPFMQSLQGLGIAPGSGEAASPGRPVMEPPSYAGLREVNAPAPYAPSSPLAGYPPQPPASGFLGGLRNFFKGTAYDYDAKPTGLQNLSRGLMNQSGDLVAGKIGATLGDIEKERIARDQQRLAQRTADMHYWQMMGRTPEGATLAGRAQPSEIAHRNAQTELAKAQTTAAGFDAQLALKGAEAAQAQYLKRAQDLFYLRMVKDNPSNPNREADMASISEQEAANEKLGQQLRTQMLAPKPGTEAARAAPLTPPPPSGVAPSAGGHSVTAPDGIRRVFPANTPPEQMKTIAWQEYQQRLQEKRQRDATIGAGVPGVTTDSPLPGSGYR